MYIVAGKDYGIRFVLFEFFALSVFFCFFFVRSNKCCLLLYQCFCGCICVCVCGHAFVGQKGYPLFLHKTFVAPLTFGISGILSIKVTL